MKWFFRGMALTLLPLCAALFIGIGIAKSELPEYFYVEEGDTLTLPTAMLTAKAEGVWATQTASGGRYDATVSLFGVFPVGEVAVEVTDPREVAVCGVPFGLKMFTQGVLVVGLGDVDTRRGASSPARDAGLRVGDSILSIDGEEISSTTQVAAIVEQSGGHSLTLRVRRQDVEFDVQLTPVASVSEQCLKAGMWIRDSSAGIGTLTFYDISENVFAGLGHPVNDVDTGQTIPISSGEIVPATIFGINKGRAGAPGELLGTFKDGSWGVLLTNDETGLYGVLNAQPPVFATVPVAYKQEVVKGDAQLITTIDGEEPQIYHITIEDVDYRDDVPTRNMIIRITDENLLAATGGVLCGMSGSPIIQNGKLIGAVTHVFVNDPTSGYAIFAENMLEMCETIPTTDKDAAA